MNTIYTTILAIVTCLLYLPAKENSSFLNTAATPEIIKDTVTWDQKAIEWLISSQSSNGGWGAASHADQNNLNHHVVRTDPATTAFAGLALLRAGGSFSENPYRETIMKALDRILDDMEQRPGGMNTALTGTQSNQMPHSNIDASLALEFLHAIGNQLDDTAYKMKIDSAAIHCIRLLESKQNPNGSWVGGEWPPILQTAMSLNALSVATAGYAVSDSVMARGSRFQEMNNHVNGIRVTSVDGSAFDQSVFPRSTAAGVMESAVVLDEVRVVQIQPRVERANIGYAIESIGHKQRHTKREKGNRTINHAAPNVLQQSAIEESFGQNSGEAYLSYKITSETLAKQDEQQWLQWKKEMEPKLIASQNPNGSWSGYHCITSPVLCTAAILQAWYAGS